MINPWTLTESDGWKVLAPLGVLNAANDRSMLEVLRGDLGKWIVFDLSECESLSLRILLALSHKAQAVRSMGGELILLHPSDSLRRSLDIFVGRSAIREINDARELVWQKRVRSLEAIAPETSGRPLRGESAGL